MNNLAIFPPWVGGGVGRAGGRGGEIQNVSSWPPWPSFVLLFSSGGEDPNPLGLRSRGWNFECCCGKL